MCFVLSHLERARATDCFLICRHSIRVPTAVYIVRCPGREGGNTDLPTAAAPALEIQYLLQYEVHVVVLPPIGAGIWQVSGATVAHQFDLTVSAATPTKSFGLLQQRRPRR